MNGLNGVIFRKEKESEDFLAMKEPLENGKENINSNSDEITCNLDKVIEEHLMKANDEEEGITTIDSASSVITQEMIEEERMLESRAIIDQETKEKLKEEERKIAEENCFKRLHLLLSRSSIYAKFMADKLERHENKEKKMKKRKQNAEKEMNGAKRTKPNSHKKEKKSEIKVMEVYKDKNMANFKFEESSSAQNFNSSKIMNTTQDAVHPSLFYGGKMRPYQVEGFEWLKILYENGVNGILADEMGLGKTIQCIAFIAYLIEMGVPGPFFVCAPLSTLPNWYSEFKRFTPDIPVVLYHGHLKERRDLINGFTRKVKVNEKYSSCPVILTSYQIALKDHKKLANLEWKMLVIDEAHRIKNYECALIKALKQFKVDHRLLLTGTPLQNNLVELWSLLNFILPEIFDDLQSFQSWFDINRLSQNKANKEIIEKEEEKQIVSMIHQILTPFLLRRTKSEVELDLPPKKEIIVYAPLTGLQEKYYKAVLDKSITDILKPKSFFDLPTTSKRRSKQTEYFGCDNLKVDNMIKNVESGQQTAESDIWDDRNPFVSKLNLKLQNIMMCLRKITLHPYLIKQPLGYIVDENFINLSGKLLVLDALLKELKKRNHKVIVFSQFVSMLTMLEEYCEYRGFKYCCLYGHMNLEDRQEDLAEFKEESSFVFLISTKAGGLGLNIVEADTVIIFDSDWNPQNDLQAQDRCHRIGQTRPVVVYRLIVLNTIDEKILDYSTAKRKLEKVIMQKGRFKSKDISRSQNKISREELIELLQSSDSNRFVKTDDNCVLSPEELEKLLDRSDM